MKMRSDNAAMEISIPQKEQYLYALNQQNQGLKQEGQSLSEQRKAIDAELDILSADFENLQNHNAKLHATTSAQKQQLQRIHAETATLQHRLANARKAPQHTQEDLKQKQKQIKDLSDEIQTRLKMGLN